MTPILCASPPTAVEARGEWSRGTAEDADVRRLCIVADALDQAGVRWWLDHGTLLGLVREGELLPWDDDLDVSFHRADHARVVTAFVRCKHDLQARMIVTTRGVKLVPHAERERILDIASYVEDGSHLVKHFVRARRGEGGRTRQWRAALLHGPFTRVEALLHGLDRRLWSGGRHWPERLSRVLVALVAWPAVLRERFGTHEPSRVPRSLLERREQRTWFGKDLWVPGDAEPYLRYRYGADWRTPQRAWTWWDDDRTVSAAPRPSAR